MKDTNRMSKKTDNKRMRKAAAALVVVAVAYTQSASAMVVDVNNAQRAATARKTSRKLVAPPRQMKEASTAKKNPLYYEEADGFDQVTRKGQMEAFLELQRATGSEIAQEDLQQQIDNALTSNMFLEKHSEDASMLEKMAMSSLPQQLPRPAVDALQRRRRNDKKKLQRKTTQNGLNFAKGRVTPEQEIELGKVIQRGVALYKVKADFEAREGREITKQEWSQLATLDSPKQIRRLVSEYRQAKQLLVSANMGLVHTVVKKHGVHKLTMTGLTFEELVQEGSLGLMRAAELFDPSRGLRFSTYATVWIKGVLQNSHLSDGSIVLPQRERTKWNKIVKANQELTRLAGGMEPTPAQIADHINLKVEDVVKTRQKMIQVQQVLSLDYEYATTTKSGGDGGTLQKLQNDRAFQQDADLAEKTQLRADVIAAMARNLNAREARLMRLRYGLNDGQTRSLSECAEAMGLSQTRVQQLAKQCLKKLREAEEAESLEEYLLTIA